MSPQPIHVPAAPTRWSLALALVVFGSRLAVFDYAGSPLPYYDQWLAEFNNTLLAIVAGEGPRVLIEWHNEHILLTTKLLTLFGFLLNGYWDVPFLAVCSAAIRALTAMMTFRLLTYQTSVGSTVLLWCLSVLAFALPVSGYNALSGLQVSFYLTDLFTLAAISVVLRWPSSLVGAALLVLSSLAGLFSMASGVVIPLVTLGVHLATRTPKRGFWPAWAVTMAASVAYALPVLMRGPLPDVGASLDRWMQLQFFLHLFSWPFLSITVGVLLLVVVGLGIRILLTDPGRSQAAGALVGLGLYATANALLLAASRAPSAFHQRHWDVLTFLPLIWLAIGFTVLSSNPGAKTRPFSFILHGASILYAFKIIVLLLTISFPYIREARLHRDEALGYYRKMLLSEVRLHAEKDRMNASLKAKDFSFFDDPLGRFSLPPFAAHNLIYFRPPHGSPPHSLLPPEILHLRPVSGFSLMLASLRRYGWLVACIGCLVGINALRRDYLKSKST